MLPLSINRTQMLLSAHTLSATHQVSGAMRQRECVPLDAPISTANHAITQTAQTPIHDNTMAERILAIVNRLATKPKLFAWHSLDLYLTDQHVHYSMLPAVVASLSPHEQLAYTRALIVQTWGEAARDWPFRLLSFPALGTQLCITLPTLPATIGAQLQAGINQLGRTWSSLRIQPYATALLAEGPAMTDGCVLLPEQHTMRLFILKAGRCVHVASHWYDPAQLAALLPWILREQRLHAAEGLACQIWVSPTRNALLAQINVWRNTIEKSLPCQLVLPDLPVVDWSTTCA